MAGKEISAAVIQRLPRYYRYLTELLESGVERISSKELSERMQVTASQIRQDLNNFGGFGQQGYGYNIEFLHTEIGKILGLDKEYNMIIVGGGNIGQALAHYGDFRNLGFHVRAIFDIDPELFGRKIGEVQIRPMGEMEEFVKNNQVDIGVVAVQKGVASEVAGQMVALGIKALWNFAPIDLTVGKDVIVENVLLSESLMKVSYCLQDRDE